MLDAGRIEIDGVDLSGVGMPLLRRSMTFIRQEPLLFAGTVRSNLDPLAQHSDDELHAALLPVAFARLLGCTGDPLQLEVAEGGANLSAGLRQLLMLARAMLCDARVLLMDEATANCDYTTDAVIQRVVRSHFAHATIMTIAHRLETIIDYDLLLLLADGCVAESGEPGRLLDDPASRFSALVDETGASAAEKLRSAAKRPQ